MNSCNLLNPNTYWKPISLGLVHISAPCPCEVQILRGRKRGGLMLVTSLAAITSNSRARPTNANSIKPLDLAARLITSCWNRLSVSRHRSKFANPVVVSLKVSKLKHAETPHSIWRDAGVSNWSRKMWVTAAGTTMFFFAAWDVVG